MAAFASTIAVCAGAALCSASSMQPAGDVEASTAAQTKEGDTEVSTAAQAKDDARVQELYQKVKKSIEGNCTANDKTIVDELFRVLSDISDSDLASIHTFAKTKEDQDVMKYISMMRVQKFCRAYGDKCDLESGTIALHSLKNLSNEAIVALANILQNDNVFWSLMLMWRNITAAGAKALGEALQANTALTALKLVGNN